MAIRHVAHDDFAEISARLGESAELHRPWVPQRTATPEAFADYVARCGLPSHEGFVICRCDAEGGAADDDGDRAGCSAHGHRIVGAVNINNIVRGSLQNGALGYVAYASTTGHGYMTEGLRPVWAS